MRGTSDGRVRKRENRDRVRESERERRETFDEPKCT